MPDFPNPFYYKPTLSTLSQVCLPELIGNSGTNPTTASFTWATANLCLYIPFILESQFLVRKLFWCNAATAANNVELAILAANPATGTATLLTSTGAVAQTGASAAQVTTLGTPILLMPGAYYWGFTAAGTTSAFNCIPWSVNVLKAAGMAQQTGVTPGSFPATATFATIATAQVPVVGMSNATAV